MKPKKADINQAHTTQDGRKHELCYADRFAAYIKLDMAEESTRRKAPGLLTWGLALSGLASLMGLIAMIAIAAGKVRAGDGLEPYRTFWMVEGNWVALLIFLAIAFGALFVSLLFRLKDWREIHELESKYGGEGNV